MREKVFDHVVMADQHGDRQIAKAHVLGEHRQQRLDDARTEAVADDHAVDVAGIERARRALDAERADQADTLADGDRQLGIRAAAAGDQHGCFVERIGVGQLRQVLAARGERPHAAQHRAVQCAHAHRGDEPPHDSGRRHICGDRQRIWGTGAAPHRHACGR